MKKRLFILHGLLVATLLLPLLFSVVPVMADDAWLAGWSYRIEHNLIGAAGAWENYHVQVVVHSGDGESTGNEVYLEDGCTDFPNDIRFTDDDGDSKLSHYCLNLAADPATFWVRVEDDLSAGTTPIYIYFGKSGETSESTLSTFSPIGFSDTFDDSDDVDMVDSFDVFPSSGAFCLNRAADPIPKYTVENMTEWAIAVNGSIYQAHETGITPTIYQYDAADGTIIQQYDFSRTYGCSPIREETSGGLLLLITRSLTSFKLEARREDTAESVWNSTAIFDLSLGGLAAYHDDAGHTYAIATLSTGCAAVDIDDGSLEWSHASDEVDNTGPACTPVVDQDNDRLYYQSKNNLYCLNATDGTEIWEADVVGYNSYYATMLVRDDYNDNETWVVAHYRQAGATSHYIYCYNATDDVGTQVWNVTGIGFDKGMTYYNGLVIMPDSVPATQGKVIYAWNITDGSEVWSCDLSDYNFEYFGTDSLAVDGRLIINTCDLAPYGPKLQRLFVINTENGELIDQRLMETPGSACGNPIAYNGMFLLPNLFPDTTSAFEFAEGGVVDYYPFRGSQFQWGSQPDGTMTRWFQMEGAMAKSNVALATLGGNATACCTAAGNYSADYLIDGLLQHDDPDGQTSWVSNGADHAGGYHEVVFGFNGTPTLYMMRVEFIGTNFFPRTYNYTVQNSTDGVNYSDLVGSFANPEIVYANNASYNHNMVWHTFAATNATHIKLNVKNDASGSGCYIGEVEIYSGASGRAYSVGLPTGSYKLMYGDELSWTDSLPEGCSVFYRMEYYTGGAWQLVPDAIIPGNSDGFETSPVDVSNLTATYDPVRLRADLSGASFTTEPSILDWALSGYSRRYVDPEPTHGSWGEREWVRDSGASYTVPDRPFNWLTGTDYTSASGLGFIYDITNNMADSLDIPRSSFWLVWAILLSFLLGLVALMLSRGKLLLAVIALEIGMVFFWWMELLPFWIPLIAVIIIIAVSIGHKDVVRG